MPGSSTTKRKTKPAPRASARTTPLTVHIDGAAKGNPGPAGIGIVFSKGNKAVDEFALFIGEATNNVAETMALIVALQEAIKRSAKQLTVRTDSELLANQVTGVYRVKDRQLKWLHLLIQNLIAGIPKFVIQHVPRTQNKRADQLANKGVRDGLLKQPHLKRKRGTAPPKSKSSDQTTFW